MIHEIKTIMELLEDRYPNNKDQKFTSQDMIDFAIHIAHLIVNDAVCSSNRIKVKSSNSCAEFVEKWFKDN